MSSTLDYNQPQGPDFQYLPDSAQFISSWSNMGGASNQSVANNNSSNMVPRANGHHRDHSSSTIGSVNMPMYNSQSKSQRHNNRGANSLPTPSQTPTKNSFLSSLPSDSIASTMAMTQAMSQSLMPTAHAMSYSLAEPMTPMAAVSNDFHEDGRRNYSNGENDTDVDAWLADYLRNEDMTSTMVPKFERTITDAYNDELYMPQQQTSSSYLMPQNQMMHDARMARTTSTSTNQSVPMSPFKSASSPFMHSPATYGSIRQKHPNSPHSASTPKTMSPQEAMLDYKPRRDEPALFGTGAEYNSYTAVAPTTTKSPFQNIPTTMSFGGWSTDLQQATLTSAPMSNFNFVAPALPTANMAGLNAHYLGNSALSSRSGRQHDSNPEFPAHLTTMESSASEAPASSAASSIAQSLGSPKPMSNADTGTYSCTYHGCSQRFATPRELQKHKRDIHRSNPNVTPGVGSGMSAQQLMERNSQSGPHRCDRINPTTGKSCNTNFSRPYDLTRHEDTIHNNRKVKLRCALCTEEKLFSRNDALTRHMRVVHPEVDFPGKHRRRRHD